MTTARPPAKKAATPRGKADAAPPLGTPTPNPEEAVTVTIRGVGTEWLVYSSKVEHRVCVRERGKDERQVTEYPWDDWVGAARYIVSVVNGEYQRAGSSPTDAPVYCGDCGERCTRRADGRASCPVHGLAG